MPRRYGSNVTIKDICYEVLHHAGGKPMHVADIAAKASSGGLFRLAQLKVDARSVSNTMATKMNNEIRQHPAKTRFERTDENTFRIRDFAPGVYSGRFRQLVDAAKDDRRAASAGAGEIRDKRTEVVPLRSVQLTALDSEAQCARPRWPELSAAESRRVEAIERVFEAEGDFEGRLKASAALRQGDVGAARAFLEQLRRAGAGRG